MKRHSPVANVLNHLHLEVFWRNMWEFTHMNSPLVVSSVSKHFPKNNLLRHTKSYTGEQPFSCYQCLKAFSTDTNLKKTCRISYRWKTISLQPMSQGLFMWQRFKETLINSYRIEVIFLSMMFSRLLVLKIAIELFITPISNKFYYFH